MLPLIGVLAQIVPSLISAVAGDKAGKVAGQVAEVAKAILGTDNPVDAEKALASLPPDKLVDLKLGLAKIAAEAEASRQQASLETLRAELADVSNARDRDNHIIQSGKTNHRANIMLAMTYASLVAVVAFLLYYKVDGASAVGGALLSLIGVLSGCLKDAFGFEFGSSRSSADKTDMIARLSKQ